MTREDIVQTNNSESQLIKTWLTAIKNRCVADLVALMSSNIELRPPFEDEVIVGRENVLKTFKAFDQVVDDFDYHRVVAGNSVAILEFKGMIKGITLQGVDVFTLNAENKITLIEVMARPLNAVQALSQAITKLRQDSQ